MQSKRQDKLVIEIKMASTESGKGSSARGELKGSIVIAQWQETQQYLLSEQCRPICSPRKTHLSCPSDTDQSIVPNSSQQFSGQAMPTLTHNRKCELS